MSNTRLYVIDAETLNKITNHLVLINDLADRAPESEAIETIYRSSEELLSIINQITKEVM